MPQGYVTKCFLIFIIDEVKNFVANNICSSYWSQLHTGIHAKGQSQIGGLSIKMKEGYYKTKSNWVLEQRFNCKLVFRDKLGQLVRFFIYVTASLLISGFLGKGALKSPDGVFALQVFPHLITNHLVYFIFRCTQYFWLFVGAFTICMQWNLINQFR